jgi:hypothetical protein
MYFHYSIGIDPRRDRWLGGRMTFVMQTGDGFYLLPLSIYSTMSFNKNNQYGWRSIHEYGYGTRSSEEVW